MDRLTLDISLYICDAIILPNLRTPVCLHRFRDLAVRFVYRSIAFYRRFDVNNSTSHRHNVLHNYESNTSGGIVSRYLELYTSASLNKIRNIKDTVLYLIVPFYVTLTNRRCRIR